MVTRCPPDKVARSSFGVCPQSVQNMKLLSEKHCTNRLLISLRSELLFVRPFHLKQEDEGEVTLLAKLACIGGAYHGFCRTKQKGVSLPHS